MQRKPNGNEYWTEVFEACRLSEQGERLEEFLRDPWTVLRRHGQESAPECLAKGFLPLLPRQAAVARRLADADAADRATRQAVAKDAEPVRSVHGVVVGWQPFPTRRRMS